MLGKKTGEKEENNQKGFTLVELIIVMAILALLSGLAAPKFGTILTDSKTKANKANLVLLQKAVDLYAANENVDKSSINSFGDETAENSIIGKGYLEKVPEPPSSEFGEYVVEAGVVKNKTGDDTSI